MSIFKFIAVIWKCVFHVVKFSCFRLIAGCIVFWKHDINLQCPDGDLLRYYLYGNFTILLAIVFSDIALIQNSMAGYIMDLESRKYVVPCLYIR